MNNILEITHSFGGYDGPAQGLGKYNGEIVHFYSEDFPDRYFLPMNKDDIMDEKMLEYEDYPCYYEVIKNHHKELLDYIENNIWNDTFDINNYIVDENISLSKDDKRLIKYQNYDITIARATHNISATKNFTYDYIWIDKFRHYTLYHVSEEIKKNLNNVTYINFKKSDIGEKICTICARDSAMSKNR